MGRGEEEEEERVKMGVKGGCEWLVREGRWGISCFCLPSHHYARQWHNYNSWHPNTRPLTARVETPRGGQKALGGRGGKGGGTEA